ncbi:MAG: hypothetical protein AAGI13_11830 [Pseudomonadota bacterium]
MSDPGAPGSRAGPSPSPSERLRAAIERPSRLIRTICQMLLGLGLAITLILKVYMLILTDHQCEADLSSLGNQIRCTSSLVILGSALALSAGFALAHRMIAGGLGRHILRPVVIGIASVLLIYLAGLDPSEADWRRALELLTLAAMLIGAVWLTARDNRED